MVCEKVFSTNGKRCDQNSRDRVSGVEPRTELLKRLIRITLGSLMFMLIKVGLVALIQSLFCIPAWANYLIVTVSVSIFGWIYHSKISFRMPLSRSTLARYGEQAISLKFIDYLLYNCLVYICGIDLRWAVLITSGIVFSMRICIYIKYVFVHSEEPR